MSGNFEKRQISIAVSTIERHTDDAVGLDAIIQDLESLMTYIDLQDYEGFSDSLSELEVINAILVEERRKPTLEEGDELRSILESLKVELFKRRGQL